MESRLVENPRFLCILVESWFGRDNGCASGVDWGCWKFCCARHQKMALIRPWVEDGIMVTQPMHQGSGACLRPADEK